MSFFEKPKIFLDTWTVSQKLPPENKGSAKMAPKSQLFRKNGGHFCWTPFSILMKIWRYVSVTSALHPNLSLMLLKKSSEIVKKISKPFNTVKVSTELNLKYFRWFEHKEAGWSDALSQFDGLLTVAGPLLKSGASIFKLNTCTSLTHPKCLESGIYKIRAGGEGPRR